MPATFWQRVHVDNCLCVISKENILNADNLSVNGDWQVKWNDNELFKCTVTDLGDKAAMNKAEKELLKCYLEEKEGTKTPPQKKAN